MVAVAGLGIAWASPADAKPACDGRYRLTIRASVLSSIPHVRTDFSAADLQAMASKASHAQRHQPLGFYKDTLGYRVIVDTRREPGNPCPTILVDAQLVEGERVIQIARDLQPTQCLFDAVLSHYRHHAEAAYIALKGLALRLPAMLRAAVEHDAPRDSKDDAALRQEIEMRSNAVLDAEIAAYAGSFQTLQSKVDTSAEIRKLDGGCPNV